MGIQMSPKPLSKENQHLLLVMYFTCFKSAKGIKSFALSLQKTARASTQWNWDITKIHSITYTIYTVCNDVMKGLLINKIAALVFPHDSPYAWFILSLIQRQLREPEAAIQMHIQVGKMEYKFSSSSLNISPISLACFKAFAYIISTQHTY